MQAVTALLLFLLVPLLSYILLFRRRRAAPTSPTVPHLPSALEVFEDQPGDGQPFPGQHFELDWLQKSPVDEPHPNKWVVPDADGSQAVPPGREDDAKEWLSMELVPFQTMFDHHSRRDPAKLAVTWVGLQGEAQREMTYADLQAQACAIAVWLRKQRGVKAGDRVMLVYPPGLDFMVAFLGCLRAGVVAVPVYPPNPLKLNLDVPKFARIIEDSGSRLVLSSRDYYYAIVMPTWLAGKVKWPGAQWFTTDRFRAVKGEPTPEAMDRLIHDTEMALYGEVKARSYEEDRLLFLQYTSGSTSDPKGVMIGDRCLAHNNTFVRKTLRISSKSRFFSWLPQYHDMGLICAYLTTLSAGASGYFTSPLHFLQRPALWLQMMSKHRCTHTATPNFALDLTMRKFVPERDAPDGLDLSSLECVVNGAEPIHVSSIERWINRLRPYGFAPCAMCCAYGLAEHTVGTGAWGAAVVTIPPPEDNPKAAPRVLHAAGNMTANDDGRGFWRIVDPYTLKEMPENTEGELWIHADSVAQGYWNQPELTKKVFKARLVEGLPGKPDVRHVDFLRTGDLAVVLNGEGFITGRLKDLIIINGRNFYPQDVEKTVERGCQAVRPGCVASFAWTQGGGDWMGGRTEAVAIVAEVVDYAGVRKAGGRGWWWGGNSSDGSSGSAEEQEARWLAEATVAIRTAVHEAHQINPSVVVLIPARSILKTTSGKIRRRAIKQCLLAGTMPVLNPALCGLPAALLPAAAREKLAAAGGATAAAAAAAAEPAAVEAPVELPPDAPLEDVVLQLLRLPTGTRLPGSTTLMSVGMTSMHAIEIAEAITDRAGAMVPLEELLQFTLADVRRIKVDPAKVEQARKERQRLAVMPDLGLGRIGAASRRAELPAGDDILRSESGWSTISHGSSHADSDASSTDSSSESDRQDSCRERVGQWEVSQEAAGFVYSIGTAVPAQEIPQWLFAREFLNRIGNNDPVLQDKLSRMCAVSAIETRYSALTEAHIAAHPELMKPGSPSLAIRNQLFATEALKLASAAANKALAAWGGDPASITHLFVASMAAMGMPGLDLPLAQALQLPRSVRRATLQMAGCHAGVQLMRLAMDAIAGAGARGARVLLVACELPSVSLQAPSQDSLGNLLSAAIFGDGAAAMVLGNGPMPPPVRPPSDPAPRSNASECAPVFELHRSATVFLPGTEKLICASVTPYGFDAGLEREIPRIIGPPAKAFAEQLLSVLAPVAEKGKAGEEAAEGLPLTSAFWALHPGGRAILDAVERHCQLPPEVLAASRSVMKRHGNMSSATTLFVLEEIQKMRKQNPASVPEWGMALGIGPGVTLEGILLRMAS